MVTFPTGVAHVHLTWTAGVRKAIYTIEGEMGAITMDDDELQIETMNGAGFTNGNQAANRHVQKRVINSYWEDASHTTWFNALFDEFRQVIERKEYAGKDAQEAALCVELIHTAYRSAEQGSRELPLPNQPQVVRPDFHLL